MRCGDVRRACVHYRTMKDFRIFVRLTTRIRTNERRVDLHFSLAGLEMSVFTDGLASLIDAQMQLPLVSPYA